MTSLSLMLREELDELMPLTLAHCATWNYTIIEQTRAWFLPLQIGGHQRAVSKFYTNCLQKARSRLKKLVPYGLTMTHTSPHVRPLPLVSRHVSHCVPDLRTDEHAGCTAESTTYEWSTGEGCAATAAQRNKLPCTATAAKGCSGTEAAKSAAELLQKHIVSRISEIARVRTAPHCC